MSSMMILILLGFAAAASLGMAALGARRSEATERLERIRQMPEEDDLATAETVERPMEPGASGVLEDTSSFLTRLGDFVARFAGSGAKSNTEGVYAETRQRLREAGYRRPSALAVYQGSRYAMGFAMAIGGFVIALPLLGEAQQFQRVMLVVALSFIGFLIPGITVDQQRKRRLDGIARGLPDAIDLMVICVESGLSLRATIARVARELSESQRVISEEFKATVLECEAGRGLMDAMREMARRTGDPNLASLVALLVQTDRFGTPMVDTLRNQADAMRFERMQRAEEIANKAPVKMMGPAMLIFVAVLMIIVGPAFMTLMENIPG